MFIASALLLTPFLQSAHPGPAPFRHHANDSGPEEFGTAVAFVGDWDGDGVEDYAVGAPFERLSSFFGTWDQHGRVRVLSGATGELIAQSGILGAGDDWTLGRRIAGPFDFDGDGRLELAVTVDLVGEVWILERSSATSSLLLQGPSIAQSPTSGVSWRFWSAEIANVGDVTGDGRDDLAIADPFADRVSGQFLVAPYAGAVQVFSGADWSLDSTIAFASSYAAFGTALASVPDMNGNGRRELVVGAPGNTTGSAIEPPTTGSVHVLDLEGFFGPTTVVRLDGPAAGDGFGAGVAVLDDVDGGGLPDLAVTSSGLPIATTFLETSRVEVRTLENDVTLWSRISEGDSLDKAASLAAGDVDGDGIDDVLWVDRAGVGVDMPYEVVALDGASGAQRARFLAWPATHASVRLRSGEDLDGDGREDVLLAVPEMASRRGAVFAFGSSALPQAPSAPRQWNVDDDVGPGVDMASLEVATMVAAAGDLISLGPGSYFETQIFRPLSITADVAGTQVGAIRSYDAGSIHLEGLEIGGLWIDRLSGRSTIARCTTDRAQAHRCDDLTVADSTFLGFPTLALPGLDLLDTTLQARNCSFTGFSNTNGPTPGQPSLTLAGTSRVWAVASTFQGGDSWFDGGQPVEGGPGVLVGAGSTLDLRGDATHTAQGGNSGNGQPGLGVRVESGGELVLSPSLPPITVDGPGAIAVSPGTRPWIEFPASARQGANWTVGLHAEAQSLGALMLSLGASVLDVPTVVGTPLLLDPLLDLDTVLLTGAGADQAVEQSWTIPLTAGLVGLELHAQAFVLRPVDFLFDGTNGGSALIRP